ncbi:MAG: hypothetical protein Q4C70_08615 [Planctomycetia bacterium]|nr:hypothetical protein [Planctomycetia bacterium]
MNSDINGKLDLGITFTVKNFTDENGDSPADIAALRAAFASGSAVPVTVDDSAIGEISGDFIVTKMDETRENGKVVSWATELKPTFSGNPVTLSLRSTTTE